MNDQANEALSGAAVALLLLIVVIGPLLFDILTAEPEPPAKIHIALPEFSISKPDVSYAFEVEANREQAYKAMWQVKKIKEHMSTVMLPTVTMQKTNLGKYYITGYTSWELGGSVATASGVPCHRAASYEDSFFNPTTCAIDPALHDFGDLFYIEKFGCFIAQDTGSAVLGKHLDLYYGLTYEDNQEALTITGYYTVYSIEFIYGEVSATDYDIQKKVADKVIGWKIAGT